MHEFRLEHFACETAFRKILIGNGAAAIRPRAVKVHDHTLGKVVRLLQRICSLAVLQRPQRIEIAFAQTRHSGAARKNAAAAGVDKLFCTDLAASAFVFNHGGGDPPVFDNGIADARIEPDVDSGIADRFIKRKHERGR